MTPGSRLPFHYAWVIAFAGMLALFSCLGLARFSFGMLLPSMSESLQLSYRESGYLGSGYLVGYLLMVGLVPRVNARLGGRLTMTCGLLLIGISMLLVSVAQHFKVVLLLYLLTGIGSGMTNIPAVTLISHWFAPGLRGRAAGLVTSGSSLGIVLSGFLIPALNDLAAHETWRYGWMVLGIISFVVAVLVWLLIRNHPEDMHVSMAGLPSGSVALKADTQVAHGEVDGSLLVHFGVLYLIFGATYMIYATFIVTTLVDEHGFTESSAGVFWAWVGFLSFFSGLLFGYLSDKTSRKFGIMCALAVQTVAYYLVSLDAGVFSLYASMVLFGLSVWAIPTIMAAAMGDYLGVNKAAWGLSVITFFFALGQVLGPASAGILADTHGGFALAYWVSALLTGLGVIIAVFLRKPEIW
jgi:predicted MFS family arabinose efflux permease